MFCSDCGHPYDAEDNFCRFCGRPLRSRLSLVLSSRLAPQTWRETRTHLWRGLAALALGTALEMARREVVRRLSAPPTPRKPARGRGGEAGPPEDGRGDHCYEVEEFVLPEGKNRRLQGRF